jgi:hypothetical protein
MVTAEGNTAGVAWKQPERSQRKRVAVAATCLSNLPAFSGMLGGLAKARPRR